MSFLGGAECSTAGNPLSQFTKHVQDDKSLQRDRLVGRAPGGMQQGIRSQGRAGSQDNMMNDFLQQGGQLPQSNSPGFMMEQMRHDQHFSAQNGAYRDASQPSAWAQEFNPGMDTQSRMEAAFNKPQGSSFSAADFARFQHIQQSASVRSGSPLQRTQSPMYNGGMGMNMGGMGMSMGMNMGMGMHNQQYAFAPATNQQSQLEKGKGKMIELDDEHWEEQFKQIDLQGQDYEEGEMDESLAAEAELDQMDRSVEEPGEETNYGDFESIWRGIQAETEANRDLNDSILGGMHPGDFNEWDGFDGLGSHAFADPKVGNYQFEADNIFNENNVNAFEEGQRIMLEGGNLSLASLAFEAAVQKDPTHVAAWVALGAAQAQNEKETPAISALEQALKIDPNNLDALMGLAVSYTNEGYDSTAYRTLERWLSVKYPQVADPTSLSDAAEMGFTDRHVLHKKVTDLFIQAAQMSPDAETMDPDVQVGLGVLFYGDEEYDKAVDCFSAALASRENGITNDDATVHLLWNRLGATLANSGRSEEAIAAYERALSMRPNFVRARYNLGVSCINIGCYDEAAAHLLGALSMHKVSEIEAREKAKDIMGGGEKELDMALDMNQSTNLLDTLRRVFNQMGRRDLAERVQSGMDVDSFRGDFDF